MSSWATASHGTYAMPAYERYRDLVMVCSGPDGLRKANLHAKYRGLFWQKIPVQTDDLGSGGGQNAYES